jgi:hypothetical protein
VIVQQLRHQPRPALGDFSSLGVTLLDGVFEKANQLGTEQRHRRLFPLFDARDAS